MIPAALFAISITAVGSPNGYTPDQEVTNVGNNYPIRNTVNHLKFAPSQRTVGSRFRGENFR